MRKILFSILIVAILALAACGTSNENSTSSSNSNPSAPESEGNTYNFKMTHITQTSHVWHMFAEKLAEELNERSDGRMTMDIYPAATLGPEKDMVQQLETGSIDFGLITGPYLSSRVPAISAWNMPFLFDSLEASLAAIETEPAQKMLEHLTDQGLYAMDYMFAGNHHLLLKGDAISTASDLKGKNVRVTGGPVLLDFWAETGANPVSMGLNEVYSSLQTGVIDGSSIDASGLYTEKLHEVGDNYVLTNHMAFSGIFIASKVVFDNMPAEDQKIVEEAVAAAAEWGRNELLRLDKENVELLKEHINVVELEDRESFVEISKKIYEKYSAEDELIKEFIEVNLK